MHESKSGKQYNTTTFSYNTHIVRVYHFHILKFAFAYLYLYIFVWYVFFWKWKQLFMFIDVAGNMLLCVQCGRGRDSLGWPRPVYRSILVLRQQGKGGRRWWVTDIFQFRQIYFAFGEILFAIETFGPKLNPSVHPHIRKERGGCEWWIKGPRVHLPTLPPPSRIYLWDEIMVLFVHPLSQIIKQNHR